MIDNLPIFNNLNEEEIKDTIRNINKIDVVELKFKKAEYVVWNDLFSGYNKLYAITYSSGIGFIYELLKYFDYAEIIFGNEDIISNNIQEIMAFQYYTIQKLKENANKYKIDLISKIKEKKLKLYISREKLSHEKIYILESNDAKKRVIMGSANMSYAAFTGKQRENICYIDGQEAYGWYLNCFNELKNDSTDNISTSVFVVNDFKESINELPITKTVKLKKVMYVAPEENIENINFILDVKGLSEKIKDVVPKKDKNGKVLITPEKIIKIRRNIESIERQEKELRSEYPELKIDIDKRTVMLNEIKLDLNPSDEEVKKDVNYFLEYINGYERFHGDVIEMQNKYYAFAIWLFTSPFMSLMRDIAIKYNHNLLSYPVFGLIYGQSKAGKTSFLMTLLQMMIGQKPRMAAPEFTRTNIDNLKRVVMGVPIIVDDLTNARFKVHAVETIKNDDFGIKEKIRNYPAVVISANEDVKAVAPEIIRRTIVCHVQAGLTNTELISSSIVRKIQKNIGTAFYRKFLGLALELISECIEDLKEDDVINAPDILELSSRIIKNLIKENCGSNLPSYVRDINLNSYFDEKVTGSHAIEKIKRAWRIDRKKFEVDKKCNELRYHAEETYEANRIVKELPENIKPKRLGKWIIVDLDVAIKYFEIEFKKKIWFKK